MIAAEKSGNFFCRFFLYNRMFLNKILKVNFSREAYGKLRVLCDCEYKLVFLLITLTPFIAVKATTIRQNPA